MTRLFQRAGEIRNNVVEQMKELDRIYDEMPAMVPDWSEYSQEDYQERLDHLQDAITALSEAADHLEWAEE